MSMVDFGNKKRKVLIVDDEPEICLTLGDRLESNDMQVFTAANGQEGLSKILTDRPDIVITDIAMPIMTGIEMIEAIRASEKDQNIPVIVISGSGRDEHRRESLRLGAEYLLKPFIMSDLLGKIENLLEFSTANTLSR